MSKPLILMEGIGKTFPGVGRGLEVLSNVSLRVDRGELLAIMGPSGSGKSTLLNIVGCLDRPTRGSYLFGGRAVQDLSSSEIAGLRNRSIGFVFQGFNLLPRLTAAQNVELPLTYARVGAGERRGRAMELLERVGLADRASHLPGALSGGQQQRVAIARALINRPAVVLADEPTGSLDSRSGAAILALFQRLNRAGMTLVLVTHDGSVARRAGRIVELRDGRVIGDRPRRALGRG